MAANSQEIGHDLSLEQKQFPENINNDQTAQSLIVEGKY